MEKSLKQISNIIENVEIIKVSMYGPESTGKTTLAKQLAEHFNTKWVPEFARDYLQEKWNNSKQICEELDLLPIAIGQIKLENQALLNANKVLFCDTNLLVTKVFSDVYYNNCSKELKEAAYKHSYDLVFLTDIDVPWKKDDLRDSPKNRQQVFNVFEQNLIDSNLPYLKISGSIEERFDFSKNIIQELIQAKEMGFNSREFLQIKKREINIENIRHHWSKIKNGAQNIVLDREAKANDGILLMPEEKAIEFANFFTKVKNKYKLLKFVPASGAATRMFSFLSDFLLDFTPNQETINGYINRSNNKDLAIFLTGMDKMPFYKEVLSKTIEDCKDFELFNSDFKNYYFIKTMLDVNGFDFSNKPKAILPFHINQDQVISPIEVHLNECKDYASTNKYSNLHFTITQDYLTSFKDIIKKVNLKKEKNSIKINVEFSFQDKSTDTIAMLNNGKPYRDANNHLNFRPSGHGALINNLNNLDADVIFIKNIDNISQNNIKKVSLYKKALAGCLLSNQDAIFKHLIQLESAETEKEELIKILNFVTSNLKINVAEDFDKFTLKSQKEHLFSILNRPIRVCGMVKNEGEPGGGPFWVKDQKGNVFLQIVETSQIDITINAQLEILKGATHFNPVDLVCGIKDYKGDKFNLLDFVDSNTGFVVKKTKDGKHFFSYELPGLWNGAMAKWLTIFVEVPLDTFNPVKTVNDLLKEAHQPQ